MPDSTDSRNLGDLPAKYILKELVNCTGDPQVVSLIRKIKLPEAAAVLDKLGFPDEESKLYLDYVHGRPLKVTLEQRGDDLVVHRVDMYSRDAPAGAFDEAVAAAEVAYLEHLEQTYIKEEAQP